MKKQSKQTSAERKSAPWADSMVYWLSLSLLVLVPLAFSTSVNARYTIPKFVILFVGSSALLFFLVRTAMEPRVDETIPHILKSRYVKLVCLYVIFILISAVFGAAPLVSLFGSTSSLMGLITRLCFFVCFIGLIASIGASEKRLLTMLRTMAAVGGLVAIYAVAQFFDFDPLVSSRVYAFASPAGELVRVSSSLGHSNYLGNFLLYTIPLSVGLAFAARGIWRAIALGSALLSVAAIVFSGTRGAWLGILVGGAAFVTLEAKAARRLMANNRRFALVAAVSVAIILLTIVLASFSPNKRSVLERAKALVTEGTASSGRLLLWRDSIKMIPRFAIIGCGPEGYRKAFLAYKSKELAQLSPRTNNESPHNAYLEAAISYGLAGAAIYILVIVYALALMLRARRSAKSQSWRIIITGLLSSFIAVLTHNIFIFDQISTGLYFFAFIALAFVLSEIAGGGTPKSNDAQKVTQSRTARREIGLPGLAITAAAGIVVIASGWYCLGLLKGELAYKRLFDPSNPVAYQEMLEQGERIASAPLPTGAYEFLYAQVLDRFARQISNPESRLARSAKGIDLAASRTEVLGLAIKHVENSLAHTNTPELNYSLLASLALSAGDVDKARSAAAEAVKWDPNNYYTRYVLADAHLARGEREQAIREAETALDLYHVSPEAASVIARARGVASPDDSAAVQAMIQARNREPGSNRTAQELIETSRALSRDGKLQKARIKLLSAIGRTEETCPDCHRELALVYERMGRYSDAIAHWETFGQLSPERASAEQVKSRIDSLKQKAIAK